MALINCPECKKEVSDRAHSCPFCGFPLDEYFEELEEEKQKEQERIVQEQLKVECEKRKIEYSKKHEFAFGNQVFAFDTNEMICANVGAEFEIRKEAIHRKIQELFFSDDDPAAMQEQKFLEYMDKLISVLANPLLDSSIYLLEKYGGAVSGEEKEDYIDYIQDAISYKEIQGKLYEVYTRVHPEYDLDMMNAHAKYYDDYYAAGTPWQPIESVYSSTLLGLVQKGISAKLVNGAAEAFTRGAVKQKEKKASDDYYEAVYEIFLKHNVQIYSVLDNYVDVCIKQYKMLVLDYLVRSGYLFSKCVYPKGAVDFVKYAEFLENCTVANVDKKTRFFENLKTNPGDFFFLVEAIKYIVFSEEELLALVEYSRFFDFVPVILERFSKEDFCTLFTMEFKEFYEKKYHEVTKEAREYKGKEFSNVDEKELYIFEEEKYDKILESFLNETRWFIKEKFSAAFEKIKNLGRPQNEQWIENYDKAILLGNVIQEEISNEFLQSVRDAVEKMLYAEQTISFWRLSEIKDAFVKENELFELYKDKIVQGEIPVLKISGRPNILLITTRAFYFVDKKENKSTCRFTLDDAECIFFERKGFTSSRSFRIKLKSNELLFIFNESFPDKDEDVLIAFAKELERKIKEDTERYHEMARIVCKNTQGQYLTRQAFEKQIEKIVYLKTLLEQGVVRTYPSYQYDAVGKFTCQMICQENSLLHRIIIDNHIGNEYIYLFDGYRLLTDRAIYVSESWVDSTSTKMRRYSFDEYDDIVHVCECKEYGQHSLLLSRNGTTELLYLKKESANCSVLAGYINSAYVFGENKRTDLSRKKFVYCSSCRTTSYVDSSSTKKCPCCSEKLKKAGWENAYHYSTFVEKKEKINKEKEKQVYENLQLILSYLTPYVNDEYEYEEMEAPENVMQEKTCIQFDSGTNVRNEEMVPMKTTNRDAKPTCPEREQNPLNNDKAEVQEGLVYSELDIEIIKNFAESEAISAIRYYRERTGQDLGTSKAYIEQLWRRIRGRRQQIIEFNTIVSPNVDVSLEISDGKTEEIECPSCMKKIKRSAKFCNFCGAKNEEKIKCEGCGSLILKTAKFCNFCGHMNKYREER